jgi:2-dehydropantoate 2-reductase
VAAARIVVLGAGSVGCFIGGAWQAKGLPVTFIGRPRVANAIAANGLKLSDQDGWTKRFAPKKVRFETQPDALAKASIVLLTVKSGATAAAAKQIAAHARPGTIVLSFQNGVRNFDVLERGLGDRFLVMRGIVPFNVADLGGGHFHQGVAGALWVEDNAAMRALAERLAEGPGALRLSGDMAGLAWGKLLVNLNNAVNALSGRTLSEQLRERDYRRVVAASQREGLAILRRAKIKPGKVGPVPPSLLPAVIDSPDWLFSNVFMKSWKIDAHARSSMADDLAHGRPTEIDELNGELVRLAESVGAAATINRRIVELVHAAEAGAKPWAPAALRREVLGRR